MVQKHIVISLIAPATLAGILIMTILAATANAQENNSTGNAQQQSNRTVAMLVVKVIHEHQSNGTVRVVAIIEQNHNMNPASTGGPMNATSTGGPMNATSTGGPMNATSTGGPMNATSTGGPMNATSTGGPNTPTFQAIYCPAPCLQQEYSRALSKPVPITNDNQIRNIINKVNTINSVLASVGEPAENPPSTGGSMKPPSTGGPMKPPSTGGPMKPPSTGGPMKPPSTGGPMNPSSTGGPMNHSSSGGRKNHPSTGGPMANATSNSEKSQQQSQRHIQTCPDGSVIDTSAKCPSTSNNGNNNNPSQDNGNGNNINGGSDSMGGSGDEH